MVATSGAKLLQDDALHAMREHLLPLASLLTPNMPEAELLLDHGIDNADDAENAAAALLELGSGAVLLKGGHLPEGTRVIDRYFDDVSQMQFIHPRLPVDAHGTGCTLASAITAQLCRGLSMANACEAAIDYVTHGLRSGYTPGRSAVMVLDHFGAASPA